MDVANKGETVDSDDKSCAQADVYGQAEDGVIEFGNFFATDPDLPLVATKQDTGPIVAELVKKPAGKHVIIYRERLPFSQFVKQWSKVTGKEARLVKAKPLPVPPELKRELDETFDFCLEFGYWGDKDTSVLFPEQVSELGYTLFDKFPNMRSSNLNSTWVPLRIGFVDRTGAILPHEFVEEGYLPLRVEGILMALANSRAVLEMCECIYTSIVGWIMQWINRPMIVS